MVCNEKTMRISLIALLLVLTFCQLDAYGCEERSVRDAAYWNKMYKDPRLFLFPLEPIPLSSAVEPSRTLNEEGIRGIERGDYRQAERDFSAAIKVIPGSAPLHHNLALVFFQKLDSVRAVESWKRAVSLDPRNPRYQYHLALALSSDGRAEEAITVYQNLLTMFKRPEVYNSLGQLFEFRGDVTAAEKKFRQAVAMKADYLPALSNLGRLYRKAGRLEKAEHVFKELLRREPDDVENYLNLGAISSDMGKKSSAIIYYRKALGLRPDYAEIHLLLSGVYRKMGRTKQADEEEILAHSISCELRPNLE
jgi:tetratricopeptide (TPR) repeat protein